jgi:hypothetical protein
MMSRSGATCLDSDQGFSRLRWIHFRPGFQ